MKHIQGILVKLEHKLSSRVSAQHRALDLKQLLLVEETNLKNINTNRASNSTDDIKEQLNKRELIAELEVAIAILDNFIKPNELGNVFLDNPPKGITKTAIEQLYNAIERIVNPENTNDPSIFLD